MVESFRPKKLASYGWAFVDSAAGVIAKARDLARPGRMPPDQEMIPESSYAAPRHGRYLLIKAWGHGFWSDVCHVLGCLLLAEITDRVPVTHWGSRSLFTVNAMEDAFHSYFRPLSAVSARELTRTQADFFPSHWTASNLLTDQPKWSGENAGNNGINYLDRREAVVVVDYYVGVIDLLASVPEDHRLHGKSVEAVYRDLIAKHLKPTESILSGVETFYRRQIAGSPVIAVHVRGSDKILEMPDQLTRINQRYFELLDREDRSYRFLLLTDDSRLVSSFRERYGERIILTDSQRTNTDTGVHHDARLNRARLGFEIARDTYLALRCDKFIGNGWSNVSAMIEMLKQWDPGACQMLVPSMLLNGRNLGATSQYPEGNP